MVAYEDEIKLVYLVSICAYRVALNFCGSSILRIGDFLRLAGTKF